MNAPSRGLRAAATTILEKGVPFEPCLASLIFTAIPTPLELSLYSLYLRPGRPGIFGIPPPLPICFIIFCISPNCLTSFCTSCCVAPAPRAILRARLGFCNNFGLRRSLTVMEVTMASTLASCLSSMFASLSCLPRPGIMPSRPDIGPMRLISCTCDRGGHGGAHGLGPRELSVVYVHVFELLAETGDHAEQARYRAHALDHLHL